MCFIIVLLDVVYYKITNEVSLLNFNYNKRNVWFLMFFWCSGGFLVSFIVFFLKMMQNNPQSIFILGIGWPLTFSKIMKQSSTKNIDQEVADEDTTEEDI